ncbi:PaaI family thioesterase [Corynebacterium uberis]|uniref:PaaI family thioesterase n=1 Tax=Corynebacterium uberis TaxID=2883169 RepID=UPI001D0BA8B4|nr:PaaI family thioesterase [Corynebacterium uberis]UDL85672.1 PaaI family thioesterase [Corynebacterium uberis]
MSSLDIPATNTTLRELIVAASHNQLDDAQLEQFNVALGGLETTLNLRYTAVGPDRTAAQLAVAPRHLQLAGLVHGGVFAAIAESVGSLASIVKAGADRAAAAAVAASTPGGQGAQGAQQAGRRAQIPPAVVGVDNNTCFLRAVRGGTIEATTSCIQAGRTTHVWEVSMHNEGQLAAITRLRTMVF